MTGDAFVSLHLLLDSRGELQQVFLKGKSLIDGGTYPCCHHLYTFIYQTQAIYPVSWCLACWHASKDQLPLESSEEEIDARIDDQDSIKT